MTSFWATVSLFCACLLQDEWKNLDKVQSTQRQAKQNRTKNVWNWQYMNAG